LYNVAPKDGTTIGLFARHTPTAPLLSSDGAQFDVRRYTWLGSVSDDVSMCVSWHTSKIKTFDDLLTTPMVAGAQGNTSDAHVFTNMRLGMGRRQDHQAGLARDEDWLKPDNLRKVPPAPKMQPTAEDIDKVAALMAKAKCPVISVLTAGPDRETFDALVELAELAALPVVRVKGPTSPIFRNRMSFTSAPRSGLR
jgi:hypothetical protein